MVKQLPCFIEMLQYNSLVSHSNCVGIVADSGRCKGNHVCFSLDLLFELHSQLINYANHDVNTENCRLFKSIEILLHF